MRTAILGLAVALTPAALTSPSPFPCTGTMDNGCTYSVTVTQGGVVTNVSITVNCSGVDSFSFASAPKSSNDRLATGCKGSPEEKVAVVPSVTRWGLVTDCDDLSISTPNCND